MAISSFSHSFIIFLQLFITGNGQTQIIAAVNLVQKLDLILSHLIIQLGAKLLKESSLVIVDFFEVLHRVGFFRRVGLLLHHADVQVNDDIHQLFDDVEHSIFGNAFVKSWIQNVPELPALGCVIPVFAEKPTDQHQIVNVVLAIDVSKLLVKVADGLAFGSLGAHFLVVHVDFWCNGLQMLIIQVHSVAKTLDSRLESAEFHTVKFDLTFDFECEIFLGACALNRRHTVATPTRSHFFSNLLNFYKNSQ